MEATRPLVTNAVQAAPNAGLDFDFTSATTAVPPRMPAAPPAKTAPDFDFDALSLDLPPAEEVTQRLPAQGAGATPSIAFDQFDLSAPMPFDDAATTPRPHPAPDVADPISRKLELAEEFRQIGDLEGARDLLEEVIGSSSGALKAKAQGMLNQLG